MPFTPVDFLVAVYHKGDGSYPVMTGDGSIPVAKNQKDRLVQKFAGLSKDKLLPIPCRRFPT